MRVKRVLLGVGSFLFPAVVLAAGVVIGVLSFTVDPEAEIPARWIPWVMVGFLLLVGAVAGVWFFIIYDIVHAARNPRLSGGGKAGWICAVWCLNVFAIPLYWAVELRKERGVMGVGTGGAGARCVPAESRG